MDHSHVFSRSAEEIDTYLKNLLQKADITPDSPEIESMLVDELREVLNEYLLDVVLEKLPPSAIDELSTITAPTAAQLNEFLDRHIEDAHQVMGDALGVFESIYLKGASQKQASTHRAQG